MGRIEHYTRVADASRGMLAAARAGDWDALVSAEEECARRIAELKAGGQDELLGQRERERRMRVLSEILDHDAEIRELTLPWLKQLEVFIAGATRERRLRDVYQA
ncbi:MAG: flagellar protein FliT [Burkholderiales bacterium]|nr:flagellar protein FliT [Burkholderiales bacterium]